MKTIEEEIEKFIEFYDCKELSAFFKDVFPLFELYNVEEEDDWLEELVGESNARNVRLIRTVYLMSIIAENHVEKFYLINRNFKKLWKRMQCVNAAGEIAK